MDAAIGAADGEKKMASIVQRITSFTGFGGAVKAVIQHGERPSGEYFRIATFDANNQVVELVDFPHEFGIWACREFIMGSCLKSQGRTVNAYNNGN